MVSATISYFDRLELVDNLGLHGDYYLPATNLVPKAILTLKLVLHFFIQTKSGK